MTEHPRPWRGQKTGQYFTSPLLEEVWQLLDAKGLVIVPYLTEQECDVIVAAVNGEAQWRQERAELAQALDWAMQYGTFEVATDNPMQARAHRHARDLLERIGKEAADA